MVVILKPMFLSQLQKCPIQFQENFRKVYQQLKIVDVPTEVKGILRNTSNYKNFQLVIEKSRIALNQNNNVVIVVGFLYNQYFSKIPD